LWLSGSPRRLALPIAGAAATLAAASASNAAAVVGLWVLGSLALLAGLDARSTEGGRRFGALFFAPDLVFAASVATGAARGFAGWTSGGRATVFAGLLVAAASKALLAGGPDAADDPGALLVARTQAVAALL